MSTAGPITTNLKEMTKEAMPMPLSSVTNPRIHEMKLSTGRLAATNIPGKINFDQLNIGSYGKSNEKLDGSMQSSKVIKGLAATSPSLPFKFNCK